MEMRSVLANELERLMEKNENIVVIDADLSKPNGLSKLSKKFPGRAMDIGIAEQNMASIAAGMSSYGFIPFISTFTPFATRRICDQVAISCAYAGQNVKIIGTDPGITAEFNGGTHMSFEDIGVLRSIPGIVIYEPVDNIQLVKALPQIVNHKGVVYIRALRKEIQDITPPDAPFDLFGSQKLADGQHVSIFCSGIMAQETMLANDILTAAGVSADIINIHTIKPIDAPAVLRSASKTRAVVTAENHNIIGGLCSAVSEVLIKECPVPLRAVGINDQFGQVGKLPFLKQIYSMTAEDIASTALELVRSVG